ncbi:MAG: ATP-binding protein [Phycisphaerae bacterium]|nr:ATP-binding protein [Phycisphaerae bacterium]
MALPPLKTPVRTPPAREGVKPPPRPATPAAGPRPASDVSTLAKDAYALQAQVDELARQFEGMQAQLRQTQKLASLGTTAAMIAHEFNNLFTPVVAYAQQALDTGDAELMKTALTKTLDRTSAMRQMADRVIGLARQPAGGIRSINVRQMAENAVGCLCRDLGKDNIGLNIQIDPGLCVRANENQLLQVMFNLVVNARQAMLGRRGRLTIDAVPMNEEQVEINVRDTGCGISAENLTRIFEPFFSTKQDADKPDRRGLGLGLAISRGIVEDLGGTISVTSEMNVGTTFTVILPRAE